MLGTTVLYPAAPVGRASWVTAPGSTWDALSLAQNLLQGRLAGDCAPRDRSAPHNDSRFQELLKDGTWIRRNKFQTRKSGEWAWGGFFWFSSLSLNCQLLSQTFYMVSSCLLSYLILKQTALEFVSSRKSSG